MKRITVMVEDERAMALITLLLPQAQPLRLQTPPPLTKARKASVRHGKRPRAREVAKEILRHFADGRWFQAFELGMLASDNDDDPKRYHNSLHNLKRTGKIETDQRERPFRYRIKKETAVEDAKEHLQEQRRVDR